MILWYAPELQHLTSIVILEKMAALWGYKAFWSRQLHTGGVKEYIVSRVDFSFQFLQFSKILGEESILTQRSWVKIARLVLIHRKRITLALDLFPHHTIFLDRNTMYFLKMQTIYLFSLHIYFFLSITIHKASSLCKCTHG